ncbi:MAG: hypothetical protein NWE89_14010 [Candidatus Bathyarchaeota archaeon]|nr:hypothetical protein [Candidatus Bathyarchaeota archaeon]
MLSIEYGRMDRPFEDIVEKIRGSSYYNEAQWHNSQLWNDFYKLKIIQLRYCSEKKIFHSLIEKGLAKWSKDDFSLYTKCDTSMKLEVDSFLIFSRIVLDKIPRVLKPVFRKTVTKRAPRTGDFKRFIEWFNDNPDQVTDDNFLRTMLKFRDIFLYELREPRNQAIVHPEARQYTTAIDAKDGTIKYIEYQLHNNVWDIKTIYEIRHLSELFNDIKNYIEYLDSYLLERLS